MGLNLKNYCRFSRLESIKLFICGLGRLDLHHIIKLGTIKFYHNIRSSENNKLVNMFWMFFADPCHINDDRLYSFQFSRTRVVDFIYEKYIDVLGLSFSQLSVRPMHSDRN